jgi:hypothetical protein
MVWNVAMARRWVPGRRDGWKEREMMGRSSVAW